MTLGQPRQEELLKVIQKQGFDSDKLEEKDLYINLSPYYKQTRKS